MKFYERLRGLREDKDITQSQLGKELNMTQRKISRMETGTAEPNIDDIKNLCEYFNVSADYLLAFTDVKMPRPK